MNKETILPLVRHILTFASGIVVAKGWTDEASAQELIGGLMTLISVGWMMWSKRPAKEAAK